VYTRAVEWQGAEGNRTTQQKLGPKFSPILWPWLTLRFHIPEKFSSLTEGNGGEDNRNTIFLVYWCFGPSVLRRFEVMSPAMVENRNMIVLAQGWRNCWLGLTWARLYKRMMGSTLGGPLPILHGPPNSLRWLWSTHKCWECRAKEQLWEYMRIKSC
jgi:hypothetical protein